MLDREAFMEDFRNGGSRYCSPALVTAIACLATRFQHASVEPLDRDSGKAFFFQAKCLAAPTNGLADLQALGLLSLYEIF